MGKEWTNKIITVEECRELYGYRNVEFQSYYRYEFTYTCDLGHNIELNISIGGNVDDMYLISADRHRYYEVNEFLDKYKDFVVSIYIATYA